MLSVACAFGLCEQTLDKVSPRLIVSTQAA